MNNEKSLVVAFDGLDKELIDEYELENIRQEEYGSIDNYTGIKERMTSELFASFITGKTYEEHGVTGLSTDLTFGDKLAKYVFSEWLAKRVRGVHTLRQWLMDHRSTKNINYTKKHLQTDTIFEKIDMSLPLYVPSYNPEVYWLLGHPHLINRNYDTERFMKEARYDTELRLREGTATQAALFDVNKDFWDFIMFHVHDPDAFQDTHVGDLEEEYRRLDDIAGEILEEFEGWTVIFMSDHGRPDGSKGAHEHNKNAFYSCNKELFGDETPHITDFHDKILEEVG
jgi:hypothetical protein